MTPRLRLALGAALLVGCTTPTLSRPDSGFFPEDGGVTAPPPPPTVDPLPATTPYPVVTLHGTAPDARRVVVQGGTNPAATTVSGPGDFCVDVPLGAAGVYDLSTRSINSAGLQSDPVEASIRYDPSASPTDVRLCNGEPASVCTSPPPESCSNGVDDDCDGLADGSDPDCAPGGCPRDAFEPNDSPDGLLLVATGRYDFLSICSGDEDWFPVSVRVGEQLVVRIFFVEAEGDSDLDVYASDATTLLGQSASTADGEAVTVTASQNGNYYARVYGAGGVSGGVVNGNYSLSLTLTP